MIPARKLDTEIGGLKTKLWSHQAEAVEFCRDRPGSMLNMWMGTGKTLCAIALMISENYQTILVVCPKSVIDVWESELEKHSDTPFDLCILNEKNTQHKAKQLRKALTNAKFKKKKLIALINYDSVWRGELGKTILAEIWDLVVADEVHRIKSGMGVTSRFMASLRDRAKKRLGLTGTPMPHSPVDIFAQFRFLNPSIYGFSFTRFRAQYCIMGGYGGYEVKGYQNEADLKKRFESITFTATKDVLDLPEYQHIQRRVPLDMKGMEVYLQFEELFYTELKEGKVTAQNALVKLLRLQQITSGFLRTDEGKEVRIDYAKQNLLEEIFEDIDVHEPIVIFSRFRHDIQTVRFAALKAERLTSELSGTQNQLEEWQSGKTEVLAANIRSGGVGVDLSRARYCIFYSLGFSLGDYEQALARLHRPGQKRNVVYIHLIAKGTVDEKVYGALRKRKQVVETILEGGIKSWN